MEGNNFQSFFDLELKDLIKSTENSSMMQSELREGGSGTSMNETKRPAGDYCWAVQFFAAPGLPPRAPISQHTSAAGWRRQPLPPLPPPRAPLGAEGQHGGHLRQIYHEGALQKNKRYG